MIIKIKTRNTPSFKQLLEYINKGKGMGNKQHRSFTVTHNLKGNSIKQWVEQFKNNEKYRKSKRTDSVYLTHEILSWHGDDAKNMTSQKMEVTTREYIKLRNPNGIYVAVPHFDKEHYHVHICASGIEYRTGKSLRLSKANLQKVKKDIQDFHIERFPELSKSVVRHGKGERKLMTGMEYQMKQRDGRMSDKQIVIEKLNACYKQANSREDFFQRLKACGLTTYMRGGKLTGVTHKNRKHRLGRLGFTEEHLACLDKSISRSRELEEIRKKSKEKNIERAI